MIEYSAKNVSGSGYDVVILYDGEDNPCVMTISLPQFNVTVVDATFPNVRVLSASLRDKLSYQYAVEFLTAMNVPHDSGLWDLNHSNPWRDH